MSLEDHESSTETSTEPADVVGTTAVETPEDAELEAGSGDDDDDDDDWDDWDEEEDEEEDGAEDDEDDWGDDND